MRGPAVLGGLAVLEGPGYPWGARLSLGCSADLEGPGCPWGTWLSLGGLAVLGEGVRCLRLAL